MNTSHAVPGRPISNRKFHAGDPQKSGGTGEISRDCFLKHIRTLARQKIAHKYRPVKKTPDSKGTLRASVGDVEGHKADCILVGLACGKQIEK